MSDHPYSNFVAILANDADTRTRWEHNVARAQEVVERVLDIRGLSPEDFMASPELRLCSISGDAIDETRLLLELQDHERTKALLKERERAQAIAAGDSDEHARLAKMTPTERINEARRLGVGDARTKRGEAWSIADERTLWATMSRLSGRARLDFARKHGLA